MLWPIFVSLFLFFSILINRWRNRKLIKLSKQLKNDAWCLPLIGHAYKFIGNGEAHLKGLQYFGQQGIKHGGNTSLWMGNILCVSISDAVDAEFVSKNYMEKGFFLEFIRDILGNGNFIAPVPIWRQRRKFLAKAFNPRNIEQFINIFIRKNDTMVELLKPQAGTGPFSFWKYITTCTMDSICESTLGDNLKIQTTQNHPFIEKFNKSTKLISKRMVSPWQYNKTLYKLFPSYYIQKRIKKFLYTFLNEIIVAKRKELQSKTDKILKNTNELIENINLKDESDRTTLGGREYLDVDTQEKKELNKISNTKPYTFKSFLELLIEVSGGEKGYSNVELTEELAVIVMAGNDTSAVGAAVTVAMLSSHPDVQDKVYQELKEIFADSDRPISPEDLPRLKYLEIVIKEAVRLYPPAPVISRHADRDLILPSGVTLVENAVIILNLWAIHRNPRYWGPDAEDFRPERWLEESNFKHPAQFMTFSYGPRNCIGYKYAMTSIKTTLATMLRRYRVLPDTGPTGEAKPLRLSFEIMLKDVNDFPVRLEKRD